MNKQVSAECNNCKCNITEEGGVGDTGTSGGELWWYQIGVGMKKRRMKENNNEKHFSMGTGKLSMRIVYCYIVSYWIEWEWEWIGLVWGATMHTHAHVSESDIFRNKPTKTYKYQNKITARYNEEYRVQYKIENGYVAHSGLKLPNQYLESK